MNILEVERAQIFQAQACQNNTRSSFEPELFTNKNAQIRVGAYFEPFGKLGSLDLRARAQARSTS